MTCSSSGWWKASGPNGRGGASSIRRSSSACWIRRPPPRIRTSATAIRWLRRGRCSSTCWAWPANRVRVSTFSLESDAVVEPSTLRGRSGDSGIRTPGRARRPRAGGVRGRSADRRAAGDRGADAFRPIVGGAARHSASHQRPALQRRGRPVGAAARQRQPARALHEVPVPVLRVRTCCRLEEEPEDEDARSPLERGRFLHELFETFFHEWQRRGRGRITRRTMCPRRAALFEAERGRRCARCRPAEAGLERARLFGSAVGSGIVDRVLSMEAERAGHRSIAA